MTKRTEKKFIMFLSGIHMWARADYSHMDTDIKTNFFPLYSFVFVTLAQGIEGIPYGIKMRGWVGGGDG
jgi:hypothetical protein